MILRTPALYYMVPDLPMERKSSPEGFLALEHLQLAYCCYLFTVLKPCAFLPLSAITEVAEILLLNWPCFLELLQVGPQKEYLREVI